MSERTPDELAINGRLRVEVAENGSVQFWSEFDGWVATVGHTKNGDGLMLAEAEKMADLWNNQERIAELEAVCEQKDAVISHQMVEFQKFVGGSYTLDDYDKVKVQRDALREALGIMLGEIQTNLTAEEDRLDALYVYRKAEGARDE